MNTQSARRARADHRVWLGLTLCAMTFQWASTAIAAEKAPTSNPFSIRITDLPDVAGAPVGIDATLIAPPEPPPHDPPGLDSQSIGSRIVRSLDGGRKISLGVPTRGFVRPVYFQPPVAPEPQLAAPIPGPSTTATRLPTGGLAAAIARSPRTLSLLSRSRRHRAFGPAVDVVSRGEATVLPVTDAGSLLGVSSSTVGVSAVRRSPIVTDTKVRGNRVGQVLASGSYWVPARMDLDTMLSKIDARWIEDIIVIRGPYSVLHGPALDYIDLQLLPSPRYDNGPQGYGSTSVDYQVNGEYWHGRQSLWGGDDDWGFHVAYGHRTGNDYSSGDGTGIPSSFKARDLFVALGYDIDEDHHIEFNYLRLDESDVEFPGQAFDMDWLVTDGFELEYEVQDHPYFDRSTLDAWYNRTRFEGDAQRAGKRRQFPIYDAIQFEGNTDVDSMSSGFRQAFLWGSDASDGLTGGIDFRFIKQELNEITSGDLGGVLSFWEDANSPIPRSHSSNPGLFLESTRRVNDALNIRGGVRVDWVSANIDDDPAKLAAVGTFPPGLQPSYADAVGTDHYDRDFALWAAYLSGEYAINDCWSFLASGGQAQRAPTLTELYAAEPFMFLLQNGLNSVTGDPRLDPEQAWQVDVGLQYERGPLTLGVNGFHAWVLDYITFENMAVQPDLDSPDQVQLKFVNTDLATLVGAELDLQCDLSSHITPYALVSYVAGRDRTRNGQFATRPVSIVDPSVRVPGLPRGYYSDVAGAAEEPLPGILPLESRIGVRLHSAASQPPWGVDLYVRIVGEQDRVATSLLEQPTAGFAVWNLRTFWQLTDQWLLVGGVENFGDRNYREHLDYRPLVPGSSLPVFQRGASFYFGSELVY